MLMKASSHLIAVSRIRKLVLRDSGHYLSDACALEIETLLSSIQNGDSTANEDYEFQNREVSILLADLRGFTAISADRSAGEVLRMLNPVLIKMSEIIFKHGGTIDKFMGDSIMALLGIGILKAIFQDSTLYRPAGEPSSQAMQYCDCDCIYPPKLKELAKFD